MKNTLNRISIIIFSLIFVLGLVFSFFYPEYVDSKYVKFEEKYTQTQTQQGHETKIIDTIHIENLIPSYEMSGILISAGLQLLGISGIFATIIKKDN